MTEGEWMGDRWSMMLSIIKKKEEKEEEEEERREKRERKREKQKLSSPLETNQLDFFSHFFASSLLHIYIYIHTKKRRRES